jgi:hypothetical protein
MSNLRQPGAENPTTSRSKVVASRSEKSRFLRQALAGLLRFINRKRLWPEVEGDLSSWVLSMHGFSGERCSDGTLQPRYDKADVADLATFLNKLLGSEMDVREIRSSILQCQRIADEMVPKMAEAPGSGNRDASLSMFSQALSGVMAAWKFPQSFSRSLELSFGQTIKGIRATRATLLCLLLHNEHPLVLITRAYKGDRRAVLDLVKADNLFLHDPCCIRVIKKAELQDDQMFVEQLKRAVGHRTKPDRRNVMHVLFYIFCLLESWGVSLPSLEELWSTFDPYGMEYESLSAFEKDFQRRRQDFIRMLTTTEAEVPVRWTGPPLSSDST